VSHDQSYSPRPHLPPTQVRGGDRCEIDPEAGPTARGVAPASDSFSHDLAQDVLVEREIRQETLELAVLFAQLPQFAQLRRSQAPVLLLPHVEGRFADAELTADVGDCRAALRLPQRVGDLPRLYTSSASSSSSPGAVRRTMEDVEATLVQC